MFIKRFLTIAKNATNKSLLHVQVLAS